MKLKDLVERTSLKTAGRNVGLDVHVVNGQVLCTPLDPDDPRYSTDFILPSMKMVEACRADDCAFFQPAVSAGLLTEEQMRRASARYHLGKTKSGKPMFWMIDDMLDPLDAHLGADSWLSTLLKARQPLLRRWHPHHCLFGLHLLTTPLPIAIVESEATAVVLSELFPETLWMAYADVTLLNEDLFRPFAGRTVTIYPRADTYSSTYLYFDEMAANLRQSLHLTVSVATILEEHATQEQKSRAIDILDFILENEQR